MLPKICLCLVAALVAGVLLIGNPFLAKPPAGRSGMAPAPARSLQEVAPAAAIAVEPGVPVPAALGRSHRGPSAPAPDCPDPAIAPLVDHAEQVDGEWVWRTRDGRRFHKNPLGTGTTGVPLLVEFAASR